MLEFCRVDGIAEVVAGTVGDVGDKVHIGTLWTAEQTVDGVDEHLDDVDVLPLVEAAYVVRLGHLTVVENGVDGTCVILDVEPVAHVLALAVNGQRLAVADVIDEEAIKSDWDELDEFFYRLVCGE